MVTKNILDFVRMVSRYGQKNRRDIIGGSRIFSNKEDAFSKNFMLTKLIFQALSKL